MSERSCAMLSSAWPTHGSFFAPVRPPWVIYQLLFAVISIPLLIIHLEGELVGNRYSSSLVRGVFYVRPIRVVLAGRSPCARSSRFFTQLMFFNSDRYCFRVVMYGRLVLFFILPVV